MSPTMPSSPAGRDRPEPLRWLRDRWARLTTVPGRDRGMSTAEYAVGTIAACAFAMLLFKVVTSPEVRQMLTNLVKRALNVAG
ncbi:DUF4244 domain-containing protein [Streptosporangium saharense]|uniref:DUF4244 domain-containing protein n=1 Tax=Streptosporangium saharense TaxID=1706840 RepID=A0A7W7QGB1_9ACTN|nr:DUF4244 domain-containing protein [Streptosporangium saharense]MBB4913101.1 hypothetical protein [Streptosporangium saharense]